MKQSLSDLKTKGIIFTMGEEKFIIRKATEEELSEHETPSDDENQMAMTIENDELNVQVHRMGD